MRKAFAIPIILLALVMAAVATTLAIDQVGAAAAGQGIVPDSGKVNWIVYDFSDGKIEAVIVGVTWADDIRPGGYAIRVELLDRNDKVIAWGEEIIGDPSGSAEYTIKLSEPLDFNGIKNYAKVNVYIVQVKPPSR